MNTATAETMPLRLTLGNRLEELARLTTAIQQFLTARGAPESVVFAAHLVAEEMVTNIIKYGYDDAGAHRIEVVLTLEPGRLAIRIEDDGHPFNPLDLAPPDITVPLEQRRIGGLGIHLVRRTADAMAYRREDGRNVLTIAIRMPGTAGNNPCGKE